MLNGNVGDGRRGNAASGEAVGEVLAAEYVLELDIRAEEVLGPAGKGRLVLFCEDLSCCQEGTLIVVSCVKGRKDLHS